MTIETVCTVLFGVVSIIGAILKAYTGIMSSLSVLASQNEEQNKSAAAHAAHDEAIHDKLFKALEKATETHWRTKHEITERVAGLETRVLGSISQHFNELADSKVAKEPEDGSSIH